MNEYKYRILDNVINLRLANKGAILVEGAKYLRRVADKIDTTRREEDFLSFLMIGLLKGLFHFLRCHSKRNFM